MKNLNIILLVLLFGASITSCEKDKDTADVSSLTEYPVFEMEGESEVFIELGSDYQDPGVTATEGGQTLEVTTTILGTYTGATTFDSNAADIYTFTYSAVNQDGFSGSTVRKVYVVETGDLVNSISGLYLSTVFRNGVTYTDLEYAFISDNNSDETYNIYDGIGMYYALGRKLGTPFLAPTTVTANDIPSNSFTYPAEFTVGTFGGSVTMNNMVVDPDAKTIEFASTWSFGFLFEVTLTQVQI